MVEYYVDAQYGDNNNAGTTSALPLKTLDFALSLAQSGDTIFLFAGETYDLNEVVIPGLSIQRYGDGDDPIIDTRASLSKNTWEDLGGGIYRTEIIFRDAPKYNDGANANSTHHQLWLGATKLNWVFEGETAADNLSALNERTNAFSLHLSGSDVGDPRNDVTGFDHFTIYVHLEDDVDPEGLNIRVADQTSVLDVPTHLVGVQIYGGYGKDSIGYNSLNPEDFHLFEDVTILDVPSHGVVGPLNSRGTLTVIGRGDAGHPYHEFGFNSAGGLINLYTSINYDTDIMLDVLRLSNGYKGLYGHGSSAGGGYDSVTVNELHADTVRTLLDFSSINSTKTFSDQTTLWYVKGVNISDAFQVDGDLRVAGGEIIFSAEGQLNTPLRRLVSFAGEDQIVHLENLTIQFTKEFNIYSQGHELASGHGASTGTLILDGVHDISDPDKMVALVRASDNQPSIILRGETSLGDIKLVRDDPRGLPAAIVVEAGSQFGFGNRTGSEVEQYLYEHGVPFIISNDTTIVARDGTVLSLPGWEHFDPGIPGVELTGDARNEVLTGTLASDTIFGDLGSDYLAGGDGADSLWGEDGNDTLSGGEGNDELIGGLGSDLIEGGNGNDLLIGDMG